MTTLLEQNKLIPCPKTPEESWKRTNPEIFFLPDSEVLNFQGQSALENKNKLSPWKVCFRSENISDNLQGLFSQKSQTELLQIKQQIEKILGQKSIEIIQRELNRLIIVDMTHGLANVYMSENLKSQIEFMSTPWNVQPIVENSPIAFALSSRLKASSPHKIVMSVSSRNHEIPLIMVLNHVNVNYSQSYANFHLCLKKNANAELIYIEGGSAFSMLRHQIELEEHASLNQLWLNNSHMQDAKSIYLERSVTLAENARFKDAQIFTPAANNMRLNSHIQYHGMKAESESGGVVFANKGKFDYEPVQEHLAPLCKSNLNLKMILDKKARASFQGLVIAQKNAQKCEAKQENKNILLSKQCRVDSEPRLEIYPHDIICKHGSATGEIDAKQLYYLQSRGFSFEQAQQLILKSFAQSVFNFLERDSEENSMQKIISSLCDLKCEVF